MTNKDLTYLGNVFFFNPLLLDTTRENRFPVAEHFDWHVVLNDILLFYSQHSCKFIALLFALQRQKNTLLIYISSNRAAKLDIQKTQ